jgi:hypothetical protein
LAALALNGPFFPTSLLHPQPRADMRRCSIGSLAVHSDCALIGAQWVVTTAGAVATARPVGGRLHVRIGDSEYAVDQIVYHPKWNGGVKFDVTLVKLTERVPAFPVLPPPGEFPANLERVTERAVPYRAWVVETIGPSPLWDERPGTSVASKQAPFFTRMRALMGAWSGRTSND